MKDASIPHPLPIFKGTIARVAIQCCCPHTGAEGSFLFTGESPRNPFSRVTPVYSGLGELFVALRRPDSQWQEVVPGNCSLGYAFKG